MRPHLSSPPLSRALPTSPSLSTHERFQLKPISRRRAPSIQILNSSGPKPSEKIGSPSPPWDVLPPPAPMNPFSGAAPLLGFQLGASSPGIPFSLRLVQLRKKWMAASRRRRASTSPDLGPVGNAISTLAFIMDELQRSLLAAFDREDDALAAAARGAGDSAVWLFWKVFSSSPSLVVGLLVLVSESLVASMEREVTCALALAVGEPRGTAADCDVVDDVCSQLRTPEMGEYSCWSDIGILDESESSSARVGERLGHARRRQAYEHAIVAEKPNSVILSNYAQLLYQYEKDLDRANDYFLWALSVEPVDAEAMRRYAVFLWEGRGEVERAEEMFLEAIKAEPENAHYLSNYISFLWKTGGVDTCYPLGGNGGGRL